MVQARPVPGCRELSEGLPPHMALRAAHRPPTGAQPVGTRDQWAVWQQHGAVLKHVFLQDEVPGNDKLLSGSERSGGPVAQRLSLNCDPTLVAACLNVAIAQWAAITVGACSGTSNQPLAMRLPGST